MTTETTFISGASEFSADPAPFIPASPEATKAELSALLRAEAHRRGGIASAMRFGKARACEFAYASALLDAADVVDGKAFHMHCPISPFIVRDTSDLSLCSNEAIRESIEQAKELVAAGHDVRGADWNPSDYPD